MYCLKCLLPLLILPRPAKPEFLITHWLFIMMYLINFFLEKKPCTVCSVLFICVACWICYSGLGNCVFLFDCDNNQCDY